MELNRREWLKELRRQKGLSVRGIAPIIGVSHSHYNDIENGRRNPSFQLAYRISKFLEFNIEKLLA